MKNAFGKITLWVFPLLITLGTAEAQYAGTAAAPAAMPVRKAKKAAYPQAPPQIIQLGFRSFELVSRYPTNDKIPNGGPKFLENVNDLQKAGGRLWAATDGGLLTRDLKTKKWSVVWDQDKALFTRLHQLSVSGSLLWTFSDYTLFRLDLLLGNLKGITSQQGLTQDPIAFLSAGKSWVWLAYRRQPQDTEQPSHVAQLSLKGKVIKNWDIPSDTKHRSEYNDYDGAKAHSLPPVVWLRRFLNSFSIAQPAYAEDFQSQPTPEEQGHIFTTQWSNNNILQILSDGNYLWIAQPGRILRLNAATGQYDIWNLSKIYGQRLTVALGGKTQILKGKGKVTVTDDGHWIEFDTALQKWTKLLPKSVKNANAGKSTSVTMKNGHIRKKPVPAFTYIKPPMRLPVASGDGLVWVGSSYDLSNASRFVLRYLKDHSTDWKEDEVIFNPSGPWTYHEVRSLLPLEGDVWMATSDGLYRYQPDKKTLHRLIVSSEESPEEAGMDYGGITFSEENVDDFTQEPAVNTHGPMMAVVTRIAGPAGPAAAVPVVPAPTAADTPDVFIPTAVSPITTP